MVPTLATYNANNFFLRHRLPRAAERRESASEVRAHHRARRVLAAKALAEPDGRLPDILCLQEVEDLDTLRVFNAGYLGDHYPHLFLLGGTGERKLDVGIMSRLPVIAIRTHIDDATPPPITRGRYELLEIERECLEVKLALPDGDELTLFVNHFKPRLVDTTGMTKDQIEVAALDCHEHRQRQATRVAKLVHRRFAGVETQSLFAVIGDLSDGPESPCLRALTKSPLLVDVVAQTRPANDRWTYYYRSANRVSQTDYVLCSPALAKRVTKTHIERRGIAYEKLDAEGGLLPEESRLSWVEDDGLTPIASGTPPEEKIDFRFPRYPEVLANWKNNVSAHCPVRVWF